LHLPAIPFFPFFHAGVCRAVKKLTWRAEEDFKKSCGNVFCFWLGVTFVENIFILFFSLSF